MNDIKVTKEDMETFTRNVSIGTLDNIHKDVYNMACYPVNDGVVNINIDR